MVQGTKRNTEEEIEKLRQMSCERNNTGSERMKSGSTHRDGVHLGYSHLESTQPVRHGQGGEGPHGEDVVRSILRKQTRAKHLAALKKTRHKRGESEERFRAKAVAGSKQ